MESQNLTQRTRADPTTNKNNGIKSGGTRPRRDKRMSMAKRGLRSLAAAVALPVFLAFAAACLSGSAAGYRALHRKPLWFPPLWALRLGSMGSAFLMGLSGWLVWAEGGFHSNPAALSLFLLQMGLGLLWEPVAFAAGTARAGLVVSVAAFGALARCVRVFREVNPIAGDLLKLCLAWAAFLAVVNLILIYV